MEIAEIGITQSVSERWKEQYANDGIWGPVWLVSKFTAEQVYVCLEQIEMNDAPNKWDLIDQLIGNDSWTTHSCFECDTRTRGPLLVLERGESHFKICTSCLKKALKTMKDYK